MWTKIEQQIVLKLRNQLLTPTVYKPGKIGYFATYKIDYTSDDSLDKLIIKFVNNIKKKYISEAIYTDSGVILPTNDLSPYTRYYKKDYCLELEVRFFDKTTLNNFFK